MISNPPNSTQSPADMRAEVDRRLAAADFTGAASALRELWRSAEHTTGASGAASFAVARIEKLRGQVPLVACRLAVLRSYTVEPVVPLLRAMALEAGIDLEVQVGDFGTYVQDVLTAGGPLYAFKPDVAILAVQSRDVAPQLWESFADLSGDQVADAVKQTAEQFGNLINTFRQRSAAALIVQNLQVPTQPSLGVFDAQHESSQRGAFRRINDATAAALRKIDHAYLLDYDALVARHGDANWHDERLWNTSRLPIKSTHLIHLAREWMRFLHPLTGKVVKVLAVDLDNTLWGGVIGEDGMEGIRCGSDTAGSAYRNLQRVLLDLHRRGILLAVCSKNNPAEAIEAIAKHPGMLLRPEHFAAVRTNWQDKAANLREIAAELNLGVDAIAFLDDNPAERAWIRAQLPEVAVLELPVDPSRYAQAVRDWPVFERLRLTEEDRQRAGYYAQDRQRNELRQSVGSVEDYYRSLDIRVRVTPMTSQTLPRIAQLTQKTNQFNLTTRRYTEQQLADMTKSDEWQIYGLSSSDRFGDNGLVGVAILHVIGDQCEIDTLLLSCRVIGRTIETAMLAVLADQAKKAGAKTLAGRFIPTKKNVPAKDFYAAHKFTLAATEGMTQIWTAPLGGSSVPGIPPWVQIVS